MSRGAWGAFCILSNLTGHGQLRNLRRGKKGAYTFTLCSPSVPRSYLPPHLAGAQ
jgi:hypothetical protein